MSLEPSPNDTQNRLRRLEIDFNTHEAVCAERYEGIRRDFHTSLEEARSFKRTLGKVGYGLLAGMAAILAKLIFFA
jgi:hypothetical protein